MSVEHPHHDEGLELSRRIFYTLGDKPELVSHRLEKFAALIAEKLVSKGLLSEKEVVSILDEVVSG